MAVFKKASADEARSIAKTKRPEMVRDDSSGTVQKAAKEPTSWDAARRSARFVMTTQEVDRYGDVVVTAGADLTQFLRNPVGLLFHNSRTWPVAKWENVSTVTGRSARMEGDFVMLPEGGPVKEVDEAAWMIANGGIRACSIGFIPNWDDVELIYDDEEEWVTGFKFNAWELTECSVCAIPANASALVKSAGGDMHLAKELVEDVLDNWVRTPAGLLLPRSDFEDQFKNLAGERSFIVLGKDLERTPVVDKEAENAADGFVATTDEEAEKFRGLSVKFKDDHEDNVDNAHVKAIGGEAGTVIDAWVKTIGDETVVVFAVEFLAKNWNGMFRAVKADCFELVKHETEELPVIENVEIKDAKIHDLNISIKAPDFSATHKELDELDTRVDSILGKIGKLLGFGRTEKSEPEPEVIEPPVVPPSEEEITAARTRAAETLTRLREKQLIAAE